MPRKAKAEQLVGARELGRLLNVSHSAVCRAADDGRLSKSVHKVGKGRRYDPVLARSEWEQNTDRRKRVNKGAGGRPPKPKRKRQTTPAATTAPMFPGLEPVPDDDGGDDAPENENGKGRSLNELRRIGVALKARREQIELDKMEGRLVDVDVVKGEWFNLVRRARDRLLMIRDRLTPLLAAESDEARVGSMLDDEILAALRILADSDGTA